MASLQKAGYALALTAFVGFLVLLISCLSLRVLQQSAFLTAQGHAAPSSQIGAPVFLIAPGHATSPAECNDLSIVCVGSTVKDIPSDDLLDNAASGLTYSRALLSRIHRPTPYLPAFHIPTTILRL